MATLNIPHYLCLIVNELMISFRKKSIDDVFCCVKYEYGSESNSTSCFLVDRYVISHMYCHLYIFNNAYTVHNDKFVLQHFVSSKMN